MKLRADYIRTHYQRQRRLSKEEIEAMISDAEKYKAEDEAEAKRIASKNNDELESEMLWNRHREFISVHHESVLQFSRPDSPGCVQRPTEKENNNKF